MKKNVLVIGSINVDYVIHTDRLPQLGETLVGHGFSVNLGGKGGNQAIALAKSGCNVRFLGAVGQDAAGQNAIDTLTRYGVDCTYLLRVDAPTGAAVITVCGGDNHILLDGGANERVTPEVIAQSEALFAWADTVVMQYEIPMESVVAAAQCARAHGCRVVVNPAPAKEAPAALYENVDFLIPNEFEAELICGIAQNDPSDAAAAIAALRELGVANPIITLGSRGSAYWDGDAVRYGGIYRVERVDTTAAGDSFIGGLCAAPSEGKALPDAVRYAAAVSAIAVSRHGAAGSIPTATEVHAFLDAEPIYVL
jgi:ribokinase